MVPIGSGAHGRVCAGKVLRPILRMHLNATARLCAPSWHVFFSTAPGMGARAVHKPPDALGAVPFAHLVSCKAGQHAPCVAVLSANAEAASRTGAT